MSMQQALGVVGGVVGSFFGYPQLGFVIGSLVGAALTPTQKTEGPRLDDLKVQVSTYGTGIAVLHGTERVGGNVIWSTDKMEVASTEDVGKGGGAEQTTYKYYVNMRIALCETPRDGAIVSIVKVYKDGKLFTDSSTDLTVGSALASVLGTDPPEKGGSATPILYQGDADQLPNPEEEAWEGGPGSVSAYRGVVSIYMPMVECPGGRVPQFSFVLTTTPPQQQKSVIADFPSGWSGIAAWDGVYGFDTDPAGFVLSVQWASNGLAPIDYAVYRLGSPYINGIKPVAVGGSGRAQLGQSWGVLQVGLHRSQVRLIDIQSGVVTSIWEEPYPVSGFPLLDGTRPQIECDRTTGNYVVTHSDTVAKATVIIPNSVTLEIDVSSLDPDSPIAFYDGVVYGLNIVADELQLVRVNGSTGAETDVLVGPTFAGALILPSKVYASAGGVYVLVNHPTPTEPRLYHVDVGTNVWTLLSAAALPADGQELTYGPESTFLCSSTAAVFGPTGVGGWTLLRFHTVDPQPVKVSDIIADQCERAGETRYEVSGIPDGDTVFGYKLQNPASARANLEPLLTAFQIFAVDEDGSVKFKKYEDITSVATISYDELGQSEDGAEPPDAMPLSRKQEIDLPRSVTCSYIEPTFDFQTASEKEIRQVTEATEDQSFELPVAIDSDRARRAAQTLLYAQWRQQNTRSLKVSRKYAFLSPGDGITVEYPGGTSGLWRVMSMTDTGALIEMNVEPGDAELYTQTASGGTGYPSQEVAPLPPPTRMVIGDWPLLRDADNEAGPYVAMEGYVETGWTGAELFVGNDDGNLVSRGTVSRPAIIGYTEDELGPFELGIVDESNQVTVNLGSDTLSSTTREAMLRSGANAFALGAPGRWEICQYQTATSLGDSRYILSGLLRGLKGTERNRSNHEAGDTFVLLSLSGMLKPGLEVGSIGQPTNYRAVSKGRSLSSAPSQTYESDGEVLRPYSPTTLRKTFSGSDIVLSWGRRTRLSQSWWLGIVPLGEESERWETDVFSSATFETLKRTLTSISSTVTYPSALQIADFGTNQTTLYLRVYQISGQVGRGHPLEATI